MDYEYFLMIDAFSDYMFKSTNIESIAELCSDDMDVVYGVKTVRGERMAYYLHRELDGTYVTKDDVGTFKSTVVVYLLRVFQPLVDLDRPGMLDRIKKCKLDIFDYYILFDNKGVIPKLFKTKDKCNLVACRKKKMYVFGVVTEFGRERAYLLNIRTNEPAGSWPTIKHTKFNSLGVDYLEEVHGTITEL